MSDDDPHDLPYAVGYRRPPLATQFKKGCSGNPRGRPRASSSSTDPPDHRALRRQALLRPITLRTDEGVRQMPLVQAVLLAALKQMMTSSKGAAGLFALLGRLPVDAAAAAAEQAKQEPRPGILIVPEAPSTREEWLRIYGEGARGLTGSPQRS